MATSKHPLHREADDEPDDVSVAPESGQPAGGPEDPWQDEDEPPAHDWPAPRHASPKDEL
jgi:hypothetical protein